MGVVRLDNNEFVMADIPGLIEGAHSGIGLGTKFLGHIERCKVLLHIIDCTIEDVAQSYKIIRNELNEYGFNLGKKIEIIAMNKSDSVEKSIFSEKLNILREISSNAVLPLSSVSGEGSKEILNSLYNCIYEK